LKADQPGRFLAGRKNKAQGGACVALGLPIFPRHQPGPFLGAGDRMPIALILAFDHTTGLVANLRKNSAARPQKSGRAGLHGDDRLSQGYASSALGFILLPAPKNGPGRIE